MMLRARPQAERQAEAENAADVGVGLLGGGLRHRRLAVRHNHAANARDSNERGTCLLMLANWG